MERIDIRKAQKPFESMAQIFPSHNSSDDCELHE